jgi:chromosome segregation ATPase
MFDVRAKRALVREIEAEHDKIEQELTQLLKEYHTAQDAARPHEVKMRELESRMDALKSPLHAKRLRLAKLQQDEKGNK